STSTKRSGARPNSRPRRRPNRQDSEMRPTLRVLCVICGLGALAAPAAAQTDSRLLSTLETKVMCSSPASLTRPAISAPRVMGAQDTTARSLLGSRALLVIDAGTASGLQLGQRFFVRRENRFGGAYGMNALTARTLGWIRIVAVDDARAIAAVEHLCDGII